MSGFRADSPGPVAGACLDVATGSSDRAWSLIRPHLPHLGGTSSDVRAKPLVGAGVVPSFGLRMARQTPESIRLHLASPEPVRVVGFADLKPEEIVGALASLPATVLVVNRQRSILAYSGQASPERVLGRDMFDFVPEDHHGFY